MGGQEGSPRSGPLEDQMNEHEFSEWKRPARQAAMFPKAAAWRRREREWGRYFVCDACHEARSTFDEDPFMERICVLCAATLF
jgi:hypothetical protein